MTAPDRQVALERMVVGAIMIVAGIAITYATYAAAAGGGTYVVTYGLIAAGVARTIQGALAFRAAAPGASPVRLWTDFWDEYEVPARTLRIFRIGFFAVLAVDAWMQIEHAPRYGAGDFNVPHIGWFGAIAPMPSRTIMVVVFSLQAYLAVRVLFSARPQWSAGVLAALFGYGYFVSQLNSYQHHYLMFLALVLCSLVPWRRAIQGGTVKTWAVRLLLIQISLVYLWAAISKLDPLWLDGTTLSQQVRSPWWRELITDTVGFSFAAVLVVAVELLLAFAIHLRRAQPVAFVVGIALHVSIEAIGFRIGLFSFFMVALYPLVAQDRLPLWAFVPGILLTLGMVIAEDDVSLLSLSDPGTRIAWFAVVAYIAMMPTAIAGWQGRLADHLGAARDRLVGALPDPTYVGYVGLAVGTGIGVALLSPVPFPGMLVVALVAAVVAYLPAIYHRRATWRDVLVHVLACATILGLNATTDQARDHYKFLGGDSRRRGDIPAAIRAYERVRDIDPDYASGRLRLGDLYRGEQRFDPALAEYRAAVALDADSHRAYLGEAIIHTTQQRVPEARAAIANARAAIARVAAKTSNARRRRALAQDESRLRALEARLPK